MSSSRKHEMSKNNLDLHPGSRRILQWLARYPLQRLDDLEVALAPWHSRSTIARLLAALLEQGLIEAVLPGMAQGTRLYHLSHTGVCLVAGWSGSEEAPQMQTEREKLIRLLPRLPVELPLQEVINELITGAPTALTRQGRQPTLVRWDWQRNYTHVFHAPARKHSLAVHLDGALALCLRYDPYTASEKPQEIWYPLFLLYALLDDLRLMRQRLDRLLRWRESAERWSAYSQMPPVCILATTPRQAERWHLMSEYVAETLHLPPLQGAVACLPSENRADLSPWRLSWRMLESKRPCHLQDLLTPHTQAGIPGLAAFAPRETPVAREGLSARLQHRSYHLAQYATRPHAFSDYRLPAFQLTPMHWSMLLLLYAHPLLRTSEIATFSNWKGDSLEKGLAYLQHAGYLEGRKVIETQEKASLSKRWMLAEKGLSLLAATSHWHVLRLARQQAPAGPLQQRGVGGLLNQLPHTSGVYDFLTRLAALPGHLRWWESGASCARRFSWRGHWQSFQPDACAEYQNIGQSIFRFWLEWDQGTMNVRDLERKFLHYAAYLDAHAWSREHLALPLLLFVVPDIDQERRVSRCAREVLLNAKIHLFTSTRELIRSQGLDAPIWRQLVLQAERSADEGKRVAVFDG